MGRDLLDLVSIQKWKCSWFFVASVASFLALVSVIHLFLFPLAPLNYFKLQQNSCLPTNVSAELTSTDVGENLEPAIDLEHRFSSDLYGAVVYRGAPWKSEIGQWLAGCDSVTKNISVTEVINDVFTYIFHFLFRFLSYVSELPICEGQFIY